MIFIKRALNHKKERKILTHPLVAAYLDLKWETLKGFFYGKWLFFILTVLIPMTLMTALMVQMNECGDEQCKNEEVNVTRL